jgi:hypothetical protein
VTAQTRAGVRELADRLTLEYAGALPPGQVLALVFRTERSLVVASRIPPAVRLAVCEQAVRRMLTDRLAARSWPPTS